MACSHDGCHMDIVTLCGPVGCQALPASSFADIPKKNSPPEEPAHEFPSQTNLENTVCMQRR